MLPFTYVRYIFASAAALALDIVIFLVAIAVGLAPTAAAAFGYVAGIAAHWALSSRAVFAAQLRPSGLPRRQQQALFLGSALVGLALTTAIVGVGDVLAIDPRLAKLLAIALSFQATYLLRRKIVFAC